jgi:hypothetical protein
VLGDPVGVARIESPKRRAHRRVELTRVRPLGDRRPGRQRRTRGPLVPSPTIGALRPRAPVVGRTTVTPVAALPGPPGVATTRRPIGPAPLLRATLTRPLVRAGARAIGTRRPVPTLVGVRSAGFAPRSPGTLVAPARGTLPATSTLAGHRGARLVVPRVGSGRPVPPARGRTALLPSPTVGPGPTTACGTALPAGTGPAAGSSAPLATAVAPRTPVGVAVPALRAVAGGPVRPGPGRPGTGRAARASAPARGSAGPVSERLGPVVAVTVLVARTLTVLVARTVPALGATSLTAVLEARTIAARGATPVAATRVLRTVTAPLIARSVTAVLVPGTVTAAGATPVAAVLILRSVPAVLIARPVAPGAASASGLPVTVRR